MPMQPIAKMSSAAADCPVPNSAAPSDPIFSLLHELHVLQGKTKITQIGKGRNH